MKKHSPMKTENAFGNAVAARMHARQMRAMKKAAVNENRILLEEVEVPQESEFEQAFMQGIAKIRQSQTQQSTRVNPEMFQVEKLTLLSQKLEAVEQLLRLELNQPSFQAELEDYADALRKAILSKVTK